MKTKLFSTPFILFALMIFRSEITTAQIATTVLNQQMDTSALNEEKVRLMIDSMSSVIEIKSDSMKKIKTKANKERVGTRYQDFFDPQLDSLISDKIVFIDFWFYSCSPCMKELPELKRLYEKYSSNKNFQIISFTFESESLVKKFKEENQIRYPIFSIPRDSCNNRSFNNGYPTHIILNRNRKIEFLNNVVTGYGEDPGILYQKTIYPLLDRLLQTNSR